MTPAFRTAGSRYFADATSRARVARSCADNAYAHAPRRPNRARHTPAHASLATGAARVVGKIVLRREVRPDHVLARRTHRHAIRGFVVRPKGKALPHGNRFRIFHAPAVVQFVFTVG